MAWKILRGMLALIAISILVLATLPWLTPLGEKLGSRERLDYVTTNLRSIDLTVPGAGLALTDSDYAERYIILGEMHGFAVPQQVDLALVEHLQRHGPQRWYLAEMTPDEALAINEYISGGSNQPAREVFNRFADGTMQWANQEFFEKLTAFAALNTTLNEEAQIRFIGIDALRGGSRIATAQEQIDDAVAADLGDFASARSINLALLNRALDAGQERRYEAMRRNMDTLAAMPGFKSARFMGLWGTFHASEVPINGSRTLAMWLQEGDANYAGEVVTINFICTSECYNLMPKAGLPGPMHGPSESEYTIVPMHMDNPYVQRLRGVDDLVTAMAGANMQLALLPTNGPGTPYIKGSNLLAGYSGYLALVNKWKPEGAASEMTDYFVIARASQPLTPWRGRPYDLESRQMR